MTTGDWAFALVAVTVGIAAVVCGIAWKAAFADGREAERLDERNRRAMSRLDRAEEEIWGPLPSAGPDPFEAWLAEAAGTRERLAGSGELRALAADSTGTMRAVTDDYIAQMAAEEEAYRKGLAS